MARAMVVLNGVAGLLVSTQVGAVFPTLQLLSSTRPRPRANTLYVVCSWYIELRQLVRALVP